MALFLNAIRKRRQGRMNHSDEGSPVPVTFVGNAKNIETEKAHKDRVQKRFAFYCVGTLAIGFVLGSLLGLITGPLDSSTVYVTEERGGPTERLLSFAQVSLVEAAKGNLNRPKSSFTAPLSLGQRSSDAPFVPRVAALRASFAFALAREAQRPASLVQKAAARVSDVRATDNAPNAWLDYSAPYSAGTDRPMIAIVIDDVGHSSGRVDRLLSLSAPLTLSILPYVDDAKDIARRSRLQGFELLVHVPMEPEGPFDPGPNALRLDLTTDELHERLDWSLDQFPGYVGINNHMGSRFTKNAAAMIGVMDRLKTDGLLFLDSRTSALSAGPIAARQSGAIYASRDIFLDHDLNTLGILAQVQKLEEIARVEGTAIAIGHPHDITLDILELWLQTAEHRGFSVVPLTGVIKKRQAEEIKLAAQN